MNTIPNIPKPYLNSLNQIHQLKLKSQKKGFYEDIARNLDRLEESFRELGLFLHDPMGEKCPETRTDVEVNIAGEGVEDLVIIEVIKPIIRMGTTKSEINESTVIQQGVVVAKSNKQ